MTRFFLGVALWFWLGPARAETLSVAAASDLVHCLEDLNRAFAETRPGIDLRTSTGASGTLFAQIRNGAPFEVFLSADVRYPRALIEADLAVADTLFVYAIGHLVVWTNTPGIDVSGGLGALTASAIRRIAIANPEHAPYGNAARAALEQAGVWSAVEGKLVFGENISQTAQFVETRNAEVGLVALSLVRAPRLQGTGTWVALPPDAHPPLEQAAVVTRRGAGRPAAAAYLEFLRSPAARAVFDRYGFQAGQ